MGMTARYPTATGATGPTVRSPSVVTPYRLVTFTAATADEADGLGRMAVEARLAACAQVSGPVTSTYRWKGEVVSAVEWTGVLKTTAAHVASLVERLRAAHSYDTPEIVVTTIEAGDPDYLEWITAETGPPV
jgi:periplasmic divalent cation tolerance protein